MNKAVNYSVASMLKSYATILEGVDVEVLENKVAIQDNSTSVVLPNGSKTITKQEYTTTITVTFKTVKENIK